MLKIDALRKLMRFDYCAANGLRRAAKVKIIKQTQWSMRAERRQETSSKTHSPAQYLKCLLIRRDFNFMPLNNARCETYARRLSLTRHNLALGSVLHEIYIDRELSEIVPSIFKILAHRA